jgi:endonuclease/exonuclease/phosphatase (EEP) superfamily protein YafD
MLDLLVHPVVEVPPSAYATTAILHDLAMASHKPVIVAGDFNTFWGEHEIYLFMKARKLRSANAHSSRHTRVGRRVKSSTSSFTATACA